MINIDGRRKRFKPTASGPFDRFDLNVRALCFELQSKNHHLIFGALGVIDLIVEYARPIIPLFAPVPDVLQIWTSTAAESYYPQTQLEPAWQFLKPEFMTSDIDVGSVFSCPMLGSNSSLDCIVVVPASRCTTHWLPRASRWVVGVIVPTAARTDSDRYSFGADRTIFMEQLPELQSAVRAPANGLYAVHYVDVHLHVKGYWDSLAKAFRRPCGGLPIFTPNKITNLFPHHLNSADLDSMIHLLPTEIPYWEVEKSLLAN